MERKKSLAKYLDDYIYHEVGSYVINRDIDRDLKDMILDGLDAFENGAFDGEEYEIVIDKVIRRV